MPRRRHALGAGIAVLLVLGTLASAAAQQSGSYPGSEVAVTQQGQNLTNGAPVTSAANTAATITLGPAAGARVCLRAIYIFSSAAGTPTLTVQDGATVFLNFGTLTTGVAAISGAPNGLPDGGFCATTGNNVVVNIGAAGAGVTTTTSVIADSN